MSQKGDVDLGKSQGRAEFSIISVEVEFLFLVIGCHTNSQHAQFVVQVLNSIEAFSGLIGTDTQESIMNVSVMNTVMFVIQSKKRGLG